jgi:hypothetical protein
MKFEKFFELQKEIVTLRNELNKLENQVKLTKDQQERCYQIDYELDSLNQQIAVERMNAIPRPSCCKMAQEYPAIFFDPPNWVASIDNFFSRDKRSEWHNNKPHPEFCCYCGTKLPEMVKNKDIVAAGDDGDHDYCSTCKDRLRNCQCLPPGAAYEEKK